MNTSRPLTEGFTQALLRWYRRHKRDLPWRRTRDPYRIWLSEIMLQQTRVATVIPYYERFLARFPTLESLAEAPEQELLQTWSGLGYYRRVRDMQAAARRIVSEHNGKFPNSFEGLRALPGIGDYTAAAIAGISFGRRAAVLDGNVIRVLTRLFDDDRDIASSAVRGDLRRRAQALLETAGPRSAGTFNQAMMELGATLCTLRDPQCPICPLRVCCYARNKGTQQQRPVKRRKETTKRLELAVAVVTQGSHLLVRKRPPDESVMPSFWELPQVQARLLRANCFQPLGITCDERLGRFRHSITFRDYAGSVYKGKLSGKPSNGYRWVALRKLPALSLTTITRKALRVAQRAWADDQRTGRRNFCEAIEFIR